MVVSDVDDFIVDEEGKSISEGKKKRRIIHDDAYVENFDLINLASVLFLLLFLMKLTH